MTSRQNIYKQGTVNILNLFETLSTITPWTQSQNNPNCSFSNYENISNWWRWTAQNYTITDLWMVMCKINHMKHFYNP